MTDADRSKPCACTQNLIDLLRAGNVTKNDPLRKIVCARCGKVIWVDRETKYCFDCEFKANTQATSKKQM